MSQSSLTKPHMPDLTYQTRTALCSTGIYNRWDTRFKPFQFSKEEEVSSSKSSHVVKVKKTVSIADTYTFPGDKDNSLYPRRETINKANKFYSCIYGNSGVWLRTRWKEWLQRSLLVNTGGECRPVLQNIDYISDFIKYSFCYNIWQITIMLQYNAEETN